jgi:hypothetical protein
VKKPPPATTRKPHRPTKPNSPSNPAPGGLVSVHSRPPPGHGGGGKHGGTGKHHSPRKHKPPPKRKLALGEAVACCSAEALAASLRLAGQRVTDADVLALYSYTASDPDEGATIEATLEAASEFGLAGVRLTSFGLRPADDLRSAIPVLKPDGHGGSPAQFCLVPVELIGHDLILGVTLPGGPHALAADPSGQLWSWGERWTLDQLQSGPAEEAWAVTWAT